MLCPVTPSLPSFGGAEFSWYFSYFCPFGFFSYRARGLVSGRGITGSSSGGFAANSVRSFGVKRITEWKKLTLLGALDAIELWMWSFSELLGNKPFGLALWPYGHEEDKAVKWQKTIWTTFPLGFPFHRTSGNKSEGKTGKHGGVVIIFRSTKVLLKQIDAEKLTHSINGDDHNDVIYNECILKANCVRFCCETLGLIAVTLNKQADVFWHLEFAT